MIPVKKHAVITVHVNSRPRLAHVKPTTEATKNMLLPSTRSKGISGRSRGGNAKEESLCGPKDWWHHTFLTQLQAKVEAESQQARKTVQPLLDAAFMKELETFLSQWDVAQLRRKELLHKRWTERVWLPLQRRVEERASRRGPTEAERRQRLHSQYIDHCNSKGFVFLDTYDPTNYNPFLHCKLHGRQEEHGTASSCKAGHRCRKKPKEQLPLLESVKPLQASSCYPASASTKPSAEGKESSRLCPVPYQVLATATADGRCCNTDCWFSRRGARQPPPGLEQLQSMTSK